MSRKKEQLTPPLSPFLTYRSPISFTFLTLLVLSEADICLPPPTLLEDAITVCFYLDPRVCALIYEGWLCFILGHFKSVD